MNEALIHTLRLRRAEIRQYWELFLRIEPVNTPLGNPDILVLLFDTTLNRVFDQLGSAGDHRPIAPRSCSCGRHPLIAYFLACEQALLAALILARSAGPKMKLQEREREIIELKSALRAIAAEEIDALAGVCRHGEPGRKLGRRKSIRPMAETKQEKPRDRSQSG